MNPKNIVLITLFSAIILSACNKDEALYVVQPQVEEQGEQTEEQVGQTDYSAFDPAFETYVDRFIEEGAKRGFTIDLASKNITIQFTNIDQQESPNVVGMCSYDGHIHNDITIDYTFWVKANNLQKEFILFHELGHCYLYRAHRSDAFDNGICRSIMRGADPGCVDAYNAANRDYYIDELFSITDNRDGLS